MLDNNRMISSSAQGGIDLWDIENGEKLNTLESDVPIGSMVVNKVKGELVASDLKGQAWTWDSNLENVTQISEIKTDFREMGLSRDGKFLLGINPQVDESMKIELWDLETKTKLVEREIKDSFSWIEFSADSNYLAYRLGDGQLWLVDSAKGQEKKF